MQTFRKSVPGVLEGKGENAVVYMRHRELNTGESFKPELLAIAGSNQMPGSFIIDPETSKLDEILKAEYRSSTTTEKEALKDSQMRQIVAIDICIFPFSLYLWNLYVRIPTSQNVAMCHSIQHFSVSFRDVDRLSSS